MPVFVESNDVGPATDNETVLSAHCGDVSVVVKARPAHRTGLPGPAPHFTYGAATGEIGPGPVADVLSQRGVLGGALIQCTSGAAVIHVIYVRPQAGKPTRYFSAALNLLPDGTTRAGGPWELPVDGLAARFSR